MSTPMLTIPESAYDIRLYETSSKSRNLKLLRYLFRLTKASGVLITLCYIIGIYVLKPLLEVKASRKYELMEKIRPKLREFYLKIIGRVDYIPIVSVKRRIDQGVVLSADAICQTDQSYFIDKNSSQSEDIQSINDTSDKLDQGKLIEKLKKLTAALNQCFAYNTSEIPYYSIVDFALKDFQNKAENVYFNTNDFYTSQSTRHSTIPAYSSSNEAPRRSNIRLQVINEVRSLKGMFMTGQI